MLKNCWCSIHKWFSVNKWNWIKLPKITQILITESGLRLRFSPTPRALLFHYAPKCREFLLYDPSLSVMGFWIPFWFGKIGDPIPGSPAHVLVVSLSCCSQGCQQNQEGKGRVCACVPREGRTSVISTFQQAQSLNLPHFTDLSFAIPSSPSPAEVHVYAQAHTHTAHGKPNFIRGELQGRDHF